MLMGRMLGAFADDDELDRPDLNKCPDCDCFFASDACPLCKKICPEEMRAGNRKPVKPKKHKRRSGSGRVQFISWYHRWWFILLMFWFMPIVGIVLLVSSPHEKWKKWTAAGVLAVLYLISWLGIGGIVSVFTNLFDRPVDTSLTYEQSNALYQGVNEDYAHITTKKKRYEAVREDKYYNALQLKYANAITCHKSQGGQWKCVFIDNPFWQEELTVDDLKWLYTAITRATEKVYLVNFKDELFAE